MSVSRTDVELVRASVARETTACRELIALLTPVVRQRVARVLLQYGRSTGRSPSSADVDDLQHDVFLVLFERDARVLQAWDPARGLSLRNFVGLVAQREASSILRSGRRSAWAEDPTAEDVPFAVERHTPERQAAAREELALLLERLRERLSPRGVLVFEALYTDHASVEQVCRRFAMTPNALYSFRKRLQALVAQIQRELGGPPGEPLAQRSLARPAPTAACAAGSRSSS